MKAFPLPSQKVLIVSISIIIMLLSVFFYVLRVKVSGHYYGNTDFFTFYQSMRFYFAGQNIYSSIILKGEKLHEVLTKNGNLNPPFLTVLLMPLYFFNYAKALEIWTIISIMALLLSCYMMLNQFPRFQSKQFAIMAGFLLYVVNSESLSYGQVSSLLLLLVAGSWILGRNRHELLSGILIGAACAIKLFCGLFLVYFLVVRRFKLLLSAIGTGIVIFLLTVYLFGLKSYGSYFDTLKKISWYTESWSVSFKSYFFRLLSPTEHNYALLNYPHLAQWLTILFSLGLMLYLTIIWLKLTRIPSEKLRFDSGFSLVILSMLLLSPLGWTYYFNLFMIPYLLLVHESQDDRVHLACCLLLFINSFAGSLLKTYEIKNAFQVLCSGGIGFYVIVALLLLFTRFTFQKIYCLAEQPRRFVPQPLWWVIYGVAFVPSIASQATVFQHMVTGLLSI